MQQTKTYIAEQLAPYEKPNKKVKEVMWHTSLKYLDHS